MGVWDSYQARLSARGSDKRGIRVLRGRDCLSRKLPESLSFFSLRIDGEPRDAAIISTDNLNIKTICTMPGEDIEGGAMVDWADQHWVVTEKDVNNEIYTRATMLQCNHLLRWIAADGSIQERWCVVSDGTKYMTGETIGSYNENGVSLGDTRISMIISRDEYTAQFSREHRFLIDDVASGSVLAYRLTKPFKIGGVYNGRGAMSFILSEVNTEDDDNLELRIADYYRHFPGAANARPDNDAAERVEDDTEDGGKKVWL